MTETTTEDLPENTPPIRYGIVAADQERVTDGGTWLDYDTREKAEAKLKSLNNPTYGIVEHRDQTPREPQNAQEFQDQAKDGTLPIADGEPDIDAKAQTPDEPVTTENDETKEETA